MPTVRFRDIAADFSVSGDLSLRERGGLNLPRSCSQTWPTREPWQVGKAGMLEPASRFKPTLYCAQRTRHGELPHHD